MLRPRLYPQIGADESAVTAVESFVRGQGLTVDESNPAARTIVVSGSGQQMSHTFGEFTNPAIPPEIADHVIAVLGLDPRPVAKPH